MAKAIQKLGQAGVTTNTLAPGARMVIDPDLRDSRSVKLDVASATVGDGFLVLSLNTGEGTFDVQNIGSIAVPCAFSAASFYSTIVDPSLSTITPTATSSLLPSVVVGETFSTKELTEVGVAGATYFDTDASNATTFSLCPSLASTTGYLSILNTSSKYDEYVSVPDHTDLKPSVITVMASVDIKNHVWGHVNETIVAKGNYAWPNITSYWLGYDRVDEVFFFSVRVYDGATSTLKEVETSTTYPFASTGQVQVTGTYDETDIKIYVDNALEGTLNYPGTLTYPSGYSTTLHFGRLSASGGQSHPLNANIDSIAIWGRVLTLADITGIHSGGIIGNSAYSTELRAWWQFEEGSGIAVADSHSGGHDGEYKNNATPTWGSPALENFTMNAPTNLEPLQTYTWVCKQGGNKQAIWNPIFDFEGAATGALTTLAGRTDVITGVVNAAGTKIHCTIKNDYET